MHHAATATATTNILRPTRSHLTPFISHKSKLWECVCVRLSSNGFALHRHRRFQAIYPHPCTTTTSARLYCKHYKQSHTHTNTITLFHYCWTLLMEAGSVEHGNATHLSSTTLHRYAVKKENENQLSSFRSQLLIHGWNAMNTNILYKGRKKNELTKIWHKRCFHFYRVPKRSQSQSEPEVGEDEGGWPTAKSK